MKKLQKLFVVVLSLSLINPAFATQTVTYFHNDVSGSPMVATDSTGSLVWKENYTPYGNRLDNQAASSNNDIWFTGKPYDQNTGLSYFGARYYDPVLGRFIGVDPKAVDVGDFHSFNRYKYANNNPYKFVDPDGGNEVLAAAAGTVFLVAALYLAFQTPAERQATAKSWQHAWNNIFNQSDEAPAAPAENSDGDKKPSLLDPKGDQHVLEGDPNNPNSGGHRSGTGRPGKSEFPSDWSDDKIRGEISDVATDPKSERETQKNGRIRVRGTRDGVDIEVILEPTGKDNGRIVTGYPTNLPRNPNP